MICPNCGKENLEENLFCNKCGSKIIKENVIKENKIKYKKVLLMLIFICIACGLAISYSNYKQHKEESDKCIQEEKEIKTKISDANKLAEKKDYLGAFQTLQKIKDNYDIKNKSYDGLSQIVKDKQEEYDFEVSYNRALKDITDKNYIALSSDMAYLLKSYSSKSEVKTELCNKIIDEFHKQKDDAELDLIMDNLYKTYPDNNDLKDLNRELGFLKDDNLPKEPAIGMTADEVKKSAWGNPEKVNQTVTANGTNEQWVYSNNRYIYLDNGIVTTIQK